MKISMTEQAMRVLSTHQQSELSKEGAKKSGDSPHTTSRKLPASDRSDGREQVEATSDGKQRERSAGGTGEGAGTHDSRGETWNPTLLQSLSGDQLQELALEVTGTFPEWLDGVYLRNGPGLFEVGVQELKHLFDGHAVLVKFRLHSGRVWTSHRFVDSDCYRAARTGRMLARMFGAAVKQPNWRSWVAAVLGMHTGTVVVDNPNLCLARVGGVTLATGMTVAGTYEVDVATLATQKFRYEDELEGEWTCTQPMDMGNGEMVGVAIQMGVDYVVYSVRADAPRTRHIIARVPAAHTETNMAAWIPTFAVTPNYILLVEVPFYIDLVAVRPMGRMPEPLIGDWRPQEGTRLHLVRRSDGFVTTCRAPVFFATGFVNAFDAAGGRFVADMQVYDGPDVLKRLELDSLRALHGRDAPDLPAARLVRLSIPVDGQGEVQSATISPDTPVGTFLSRPIINPLVAQKPYRFTYGSVCTTRPRQLPNALSKIDIQNREALVWSEEGSQPGEPIFVPRPGARTEDDGVLLSVVASVSGSAYLLALDGHTFAEMGRALCPHALPFGFHSTFIPGSEIPVLTFGDVTATPREQL